MGPENVPAAQLVQSSSAASENVPARHGAQDEVTADAEDDHVSDTNKPAPHAMGSSVGIVVG